MTIRLHQGDLNDIAAYGDTIAVDTETQGLELHRDRLCLVQLSSGDGSADLVQIAPEQAAAPNLSRLLSDPSRTKLFHFARFDLAVLYRGLGIMAAPAYCTKIASRLTRTYTDRHSLRDLTRELLGITLDKQQQSSDWAAATLSAEQQTYAALDVLHLHALKEALDGRLARENRGDLAQGCFDFLPTRARLDLAGWQETDIFAHS